MLMVMMNIMMMMMMMMMKSNVGVDDDEDDFGIVMLLHRSVEELVIRITNVLDIQMCLSNSLAALAALYIHWLMTEWVSHS